MMSRTEQLERLRTLEKETQRIIRELEEQRAVYRQIGLKTGLIDRDLRKEREYLKEVQEQISRMEQIDQMAQGMDA